MFSLVAYTANVVFHPVIIVNQDAIERRKHDGGDVRMHQEQNDYHSWY